MRRFTNHIGFATFAGLTLIAVCLVSCGSKTPVAMISNCFTSPLRYLEPKEGQPRVRVDLELVVSCNATHPFELSEVATSGDSPVLGIEQGGVDTCLHKQFKTRGERCTLQMFFDPRNQPGPYETIITFQYAGENETYIARVSGYIRKA
jgi:hypothetical protein